MDDSQINFQMNSKKREENPYMQKDKVLNQISELFFHQGLISLKEKKRFDELIKNKEEK